MDHDRFSDTPGSRARPEVCCKNASCTVAHMASSQRLYHGVLIAPTRGRNWAKRAGGRRVGAVLIAPTRGRNTQMKIAAFKVRRPHRPYEGSQTRVRAAGSRLSVLEPWGFAAPWTPRAPGHSFARN